MGFHFLSLDWGWYWCNLNFNCVYVLKHKYKTAHPENVTRHEWDVLGYVSLWCKSKQQGNKQLSYLIPVLHSGLHHSLIFLSFITHSSHIITPPSCKQFCYQPQLLFANILNRNYRTKVYKLKLLCSSTTLHISAHELCWLVQAQQWDHVEGLFKVLLGVFLHFWELKRCPQHWVCCPLLLRPCSL